MLPTWRCLYPVKMAAVPCNMWQLAGSAADTDRTGGGGGNRFPPPGTKNPFLLYSNMKKLKIKEQQLIINKCFSILLVQRGSFLAGRARGRSRHYLHVPALPGTTYLKISWHCLFKWMDSKCFNKKPYTCTLSVLPLRLFILLWCRGI